MANLLLRSSTITRFDYEDLKLIAELNILTDGFNQGKNEIYKIIGDKVMQVLLVEDDQTLFQELKKN